MQHKFAVKWIEAIQKCQATIKWSTQFLDTISQIRPYICIFMSANLGCQTKAAAAPAFFSALQTIQQKISFCLLIFSQHFDCSRKEVLKTFYPFWPLLFAHERLSWIRNKKSQLLILLKSQTILYSIQSIYFQNNTKNYTISQCLKITEKVSLKFASEASYVYVLSGQKLIKNAQNGSF